jgi:hypothetical protein
MQREAVVRTLSAYKQEFSAKYGVTRLGVFGSVGREEAGGVSDVDIVVEMPPDLVKMVPMKEPGGGPRRLACSDPPLSFPQ